MKKTIQILKFFFIINIIWTFLLVSTLLNFIPAPELSRQKWRMHLLSFWAKVILFVTRIKTNVIGVRDRQQSYLIISNHLSYLDVMILSALCPTRFVTSVEMGTAPGLGVLTNVGGCLFVERRNRNNLPKEIEQIAENLKKGINVVVFPEATSTNGEAVKQFKRPLFRASSLGGVPIQPVCLNYKSINGEALKQSNRDMVFWYGDMDFLPHLWNLLSLRRIEVEVSFLPVLPSTEDVHQLSTKSYELITERFEPCTT
ncbi:MAG: 1-acyl-sn-glycerol-3-phosphate acyltransferase [Bdellovibrionales bacterium]|nr:1-acyl-sn-glycerol-3-phosphate acyltransferase [Bdellovibrionales bacterium]